MSTHFCCSSLKIWPHRLTVRTPGFHPGNRSSILREVTKSAQFRKLPPAGAIFSLAARSACQCDFRGEIRNWSSFMTTSFCRICRFDPKISRHKDFLAARSSLFAILQIETARSSHALIGSTHVKNAHRRLLNFFLQPSLLSE